jgi:hypothetical protein
MAEETRPLRVMPGDEIEWEVEISSQSRIHMVCAFFFKETEDPNPRQLALGGELVHRWMDMRDPGSNLTPQGH